MEKVNERSQGGFASPSDSLNLLNTVLIIACAWYWWGCASNWVIIVSGFLFLIFCRLSAENAIFTLAIILVLFICGDSFKEYLLRNKLGKYVQTNIAIINKESYRFYIEKNRFPDNNSEMEGIPEHIEIAPGGMFFLSIQEVDSKLNGHVITIEQTLELEKGRAIFSCDSERHKYLEIWEYLPMNCRRGTPYVLYLDESKDF